MSQDASEYEDVDLSTDNLIPKGVGVVQLKPPDGLTRPAENLLGIANHCLRTGDLEMAARIGARVVFADMAEIHDRAGGDPKLERDLLRVAEKRQKLWLAGLKGVIIMREAQLRQDTRREPRVQQTVVNTTGAVQVNTGAEPKPEPVISERQRAWQEKTAQLRAKVG